MNTAALAWQRIGTRSAALRDALLLALVTLGTLLVELALVERKYAIIGGGFGQSQALQGFGPIAAFALVVAACHGLLLSFLFLGLRGLHRRLGIRPALFRINFLVLVPGLIFAALAAKYEVLSYFSDAISFQLIRNLGGGSLFDALLFVLSEGALMAAGLAGGIGLYVLALRWYGRRLASRGSTATEPSDQAGLILPARLIVLTALGVGAALYFANLRSDIGGAARRFNAVWLLQTILAEATDVDRDGYGLFSQPPDSHPFDGARYPYALDVPGNGIDEDGIGGDFILGGASTAELAPPPTPQLPARRKHLIVIVLESTRADVLGKRIADREVAPNLNALAASGSSFPAAYSHVGFTTESLKSLFSGSLETDARAPSLFRDLKANGYRIGVFSGQPESFGGIAEAVGMTETADVFRDGEVLKEERAHGFAAKGSLLVDGKVLLREFDRSFGRREDWRRPVFVYFNLQSAHFPYHYPDMEQILPGRPIPRSAIAPDKRDWVAATYWNAVAHADRQIGEIIGRLKALGVYEDSLLVVTADHGESLFDDGFLGHGHMLNRQQTQIPLVVNQPGAARPNPIGLADFRPLILQLLGADLPARHGGAVLQYIGTLDRPAFVGMVEAGQRWTVLKLADRTVRFSDVAGVHGYKDLASSPSLRDRAARLVAAWERERWIRDQREARTTAH
jgi:phosphoglycerol transferase MdoB-like AlkP superfamily enzyme